jgi:PhnB protein
MAVEPIPEGYHSVTPYLAVDGADKLLEFLKQAFGAEEIFSMSTSDGKIGHAEVRIGDSVVMLAEAPTTAQGSAMPGMIHLYLDDADEAYRRALEAGAVSLREPTDQFYGDRTGGVEDPVGNHWWLATHVEDVPPEEMAKRAEEWEARQQA